MTTLSRPQIGWGFWIKWIAANALGITVSIGILLVGVDLSPTFLWGSSLLGCTALWLILGVPAGVGISQQVVLRQYVGWARTWIWTSISGWVLGFFVMMFLISTNLASVIVLGSVALGTTIGMLQWSILRQHVHKSIWWIATNAIAVAVSTSVGFVLSTLVNRSMAQVFPATNNLWERLLADGLLAGTVMGSVIFGLITGFALMWLLRHPIQQPNQPPSSVSSM